MVDLVDRQDILVFRNVQVCKLVDTFYYLYMRICPLIFDNQDVFQLGFVQISGTFQVPLAKVVLHYPFSYIVRNQDVVQ